ncbi:malate synthase A [Flammeovirga pectinis]|uniref:Malate synthase n=1 Tax=Flammeovirga pectinis TaxID=2494373 RepID=A0A3Q9FL24_9BACT|nr:malate synthase A [Flammeovirga pectinis]AZQ62141.1 malate synthase A [Flammeovirga pectinis]
MRGQHITQIENLEIRGLISNEFDQILTPEALEFVVQLHKKFAKRRAALLEARKRRQESIDEGKMPNFLAETAYIRNSEWTVADVKEDLKDRRVEITGPVDRKMIINALNSGANVFMADFEDANSPTWENNIQGQINLRDANKKTISFENLKNGKTYSLNEKTATLMVRPRGWHLEEKHILIDGKPALGGLVDFGLYFFHNAKELIKRGSAPYFYLPKIESHLEARLWNDIFVFAQQEMNIPQGSIKATVLIETILAAFEMDEILYALKEHSAGLNCGRWDYIFSYIKKFRNDPKFIMPNRDQVTMKVHFMKSYYELLIQTCHKRKAFAMGGMAAQIPIKNDAKANQKAIDKVAKDKTREALAGHDGTWVAHPGLVATAKEVFDRYMGNPNNIDKPITFKKITAEDLLKVPTGDITLEGLKNNIDVGIQYIARWLDGQGAVPIYNLMEDAATAEISRTQVWQWIQHQAKMADGTPITKELYQSLIPEVMETIKNYVGEETYQQGKYNEAFEIFDMLVTKDEFIEFLTLPAYAHIG